MVTDAAAVALPPGSTVADHGLLIEAVASGSGHPHLGPWPQWSNLVSHPGRQSCHEDCARLAANSPMRQARHRLCHASFALARLAVEAPEHRVHERLQHYQQGR